MDFDVRPGLPRYLSDAVAAARPAASRPGDPSPRTAARLVVAPAVVPLEPGDWLVADWPAGPRGLAVRFGAGQLALAGAQAYELARAAPGRTALVAHGVVRPEACGPVFEAVPGTRPWLAAGPTASDKDLLVLANAAVLGRAADSEQMAALAHRYLVQADPLAAALERARDDLAQSRRRERDLRVRLDSIAQSRWHRLGRRLRRALGAMRRAARLGAR
jgi:hypothetical protein